MEGGGGQNNSNRQYKEKRMGQEPSKTKQGIVGGQAVVSRRVSKLEGALRMSKNR